MDAAIRGAICPARELAIQSSAIAARIPVTGVKSPAIKNTPRAAATICGSRWPQPADPEMVLTAS